MKKWIQKAINPNKKNALREKLKVKEGENIPEDKLRKAEKSRNKSTRKQAFLAENLKKITKKN